MNIHERPMSGGQSTGGPEGCIGCVCNALPMVPLIKICKQEARNQKSNMSACKCVSSADGPADRSQIKQAQASACKLQARFLATSNFATILMLLPLLLLVVPHFLHPEPMRTQTEARSNNLHLQHQRHQASGQFAKFLNAFHLPMGVGGSSDSSGSGRVSATDDSGSSSAQSPSVGPITSPPIAPKPDNAASAPVLASGLLDTGGSMFSRRDLAAASLETASRGGEQAMGAAGSGQRRAGKLSKVCQVNDGESVAILEIEESRGSDMSQSTNPAELPIKRGDESESEIELKIESETHKYFRIEDNKRLRLIRPLDRDATLRENSTTQLSQPPISSIYLQISCTQKAAKPSGAKKVIIPVLVKVLDSNDNAPIFSQPSYTIQVDELAPIGTILTSQVYAVDLDSANNGQLEYSLLAGEPAAESSSSWPSSVDRTKPMRLTERDETTSAHRQPAQVGHQAAPTSSSPATSTQPPPPPPPTTTTSQPPEVPPTVATEADSATKSTQSSSPASDGHSSPMGPQTSTAAPRPGGSPTINLNSEPILNGPMEDPEEEESDEALLASLNGSNSSSLELPGDDSESSESLLAKVGLPSGSGLGQAPGAQVANYGRRRRRRHSLTKEHQIHELAPATTAADAGEQPGARLSPASDTMRPSEAPASDSDSRPAKRHLDASPPWTNLMTLTTVDDLAANQGASVGPISAGPLEAAGRQPARGTQTGKAAQTEAAAIRGSADELDLFALEISPQTGRPIIRLKRQLDFETQRSHLLVIQATDLATNKSERLVGRATILIKVLDGDDQPPAFVLDQTGCATSSPTQTTVALGQEPPSSPGIANAVAVAVAATTTAPTTVGAPPAPPPSDHQEASWQGAAKQPASLADELSFDFGDTLALDDSLIDEAEPQATGQSRARRPASSLGPQNRSRSGANQRHSRHELRLSQHQCLAGLQRPMSASKPAGANQVAEYYSSIMGDDSQYLLRIVPQAIKARDRDQLNAPIRYSILNGSLLDYQHYFQINPLDGSIKQIAPIERLIGLPAPTSGPPGAAPSEQPLVRAMPAATSGGPVAGQAHSGAQAANQIVLWIQAQEVSQNRLAALARLTIEVVASDRSPPVLVPNSYQGFIEENSPIGSRVYLADPRQLGTANATRPPGAVHLRVQVLDDDQTNPGAAGNKFEFETTSDLFKVDHEGFVYVASGQLDCDPPNQASHLFQVTARQLGLVSSRSISSPISLNVSLLDANDNGPQLANGSLGLGPLQMAANSRGGSRPLIQLRAHDPDRSEANSRMHFALKHVSNMGKERFRIDEESGQIEALGRFQAGEQFSLSVQVADELGRQSQAILEVLVGPGANTGGPQFVAPDQWAPDELATGRWPSNYGANYSSLQLGLARDSDAGLADKAGRRQQQLVGQHSSSQAVGQLQSHWTIEVNEAIAVGSAVLQVRAIDPENDPITYHLAEGNSNADFQLNSKTGLLSVAHKLDREEISAYNLLVQARDSGGLTTSRHLQISITDANDQNPIFGQSHYVFEVEEGQGRRPLGRVSASDGDLGDNGRVSYSLVWVADGQQQQQQQQLQPSQEEPVAATASNQLAPDPVFAIDEQSGTISLLRALDYEQSRSHTLLIRASDHGETPRTSSVSVQVRVLDVQDEEPYFERYHFELRVEENRPNQRLALIQARDPDSRPQISYCLLAGDSSLFQVDPVTGLVSTRQGLDFETSRTHTILLGTNESASAASFDLVGASNAISDSLLASAAGNLSEPKQPLRSPVVRIDIQVLDANDNAPQFLSQQPIPLRVPDSAPPGHQVVRLQALDADGSAPNNQVRYELLDGAGQQPGPEDHADKCGQLFLIDPTSGWLMVRADLRRELISECQLLVRAHDLADQSRSAQLSSTLSVTLLIDHLVDNSASSMAGFADSSFVVELSENLPPNSLVRVLPVINKPRLASESGAMSWPMSCELLGGNELGYFHVVANEQQDCELRTRADSLLDYEQKSRFLLTIRLNSIGSNAANPSGQILAPGQQTGPAGGHQAPKLIAQVLVNLVDRNDHRPTFSEPARYGRLTKQKFLAAIASDSPSDTQVIQVRAQDLDGHSGSNGLVTYELTNELELDGRFKVDPVSGVVRTCKPVEDLPSSRLPIKLRILARDNPETASETLESNTEIVLNLIEDKNRICLALKDTPVSRLLDIREELLSALQERTGLISGLERVESLKLQRNSSYLEADVTGTDVWFHLIEPGSLRILSSDDSRIRSALFDSRAQSILFDVLGQTLGINKAKIRLPFSLNGGNLPGGQQTGRRGPGSSLLLLGAIQTDSSDRLAPTLILVGLFIALMGAIVLIYQCGASAGWTLATSEHRQAAAVQLNGSISGLGLGQQQQLASMFAAKDKLMNYCANNYPAQYQLGPASLQGAGLQTPQEQQSFNNPFVATQSQLHKAHHLQPLTEQQNPINLSTPGNINGGQYLINSKEYETQMLKMSVLFDDGHSLDEQNLHHDQQIISKNLL